MTKAVVKVYWNEESGEAKIDSKELDKLDAVAFNDCMEDIQAWIDNIKKKKI